MAPFVVTMIKIMRKLLRREAHLQRGGNPTAKGVFLKNEDSFPETALKSLLDVYDDKDFYKRKRNSCSKWWQNFKINYWPRAHYLPAVLERKTLVYPSSRMTDVNVFVPKVSPLSAPELYDSTTRH
ncbi:hypothetical protein J6590_080617 [Homalodisca vitripennis]|nr:hypothetical protein J6590_080617 [Homalodisca vitripennis]